MYFTLKCHYYNLKAMFCGLLEIPQNFSIFISIIYIFFSLFYRMDAFECNVKNITLRDIQKVIESIAKITGNISDSHSLALIISSSGESTFTSSACKLLSEINFGHPLTKVVTNAAMNYTSLYGGDCKHFIFILHEVFSMLCNKILGSDDIYMRRKLINEICSIKKILPCIFKNIHCTSVIDVIDSDLNLFFKHLSSIILTFMLSKFSGNISKTLTVLLCAFIKNVRNESNSLKNILQYVISRFDMFVCRVLSPVTESKVIEGLLFYRTHVSSLNLQNAKFVVVHDLTMKIETEVVSWNIANESFASKLNPTFVYEKVFEYFKSLGISLLLTSSTGDNYVKALCTKYNIFLIDRLDKEETEYLMLCLQVNSLENLNESVDSKNIGELNFAKSFSYNNSHFFHLKSSNHMNVLNAYHILLSAPCKSIWKEYYSECLNCFKLISCWLESDNSIRHHRGFSDAELDISNESNKSLTNVTHCSLCLELKSSWKNRGDISFLEMKSHKDGTLLLNPGGWEYLFKSCIKLIPDKLKLSCCSMLPALSSAVEKSLCNRMCISLSDIKDFDIHSAEFFTKNKLGDIEFLEPVICNEIMINNILDLILQLLKINYIIFQK